jgi:hypothetical protein
MKGGGLYYMGGAYILIFIVESVRVIKVELPLQNRRISYYIKFIT